MALSKLKPFNHYQLQLIFVGGEERIISWCQGQHLISKSRKCPVCGGEARLQFRKLGTGNARWRCHRTVPVKHDWVESATKHTWFEDSKFGIVEILELSYLFSHGHTRYKDLCWETAIHHTTTSMETVSDWVNYCRETCFAVVDESMKEDYQIGGPGRRVEIDETKIGKIKYNRGRLVEGSWILGMVELNDYVDGQRLKGGRLMLEVLKDRTEETLLGLITKHVRPGTSVYTDGWAGYKNLGDAGYDHLTVIHEKNFVDPDTGAHTQTIESAWRPLKRALSTGGVSRENLWLHLCEYLWRKEAHRLGKDPFLYFLDSASLTYSPYQLDELFEHNG